VKLTDKFRIKIQLNSLRLKKQPYGEDYLTNTLDARVVSFVSVFGFNLGQINDYPATSYFKLFLGDG
jgi:hypothetical protein